MGSGNFDYQEALRKVVETDSSDLFLKAGSVPCIRTDGIIEFIGETPLSESDIDGVYQAVVKEKAKALFDSHGEVDVAYEHPDFGRFRINAYLQKGRKGIVFRSIKKRIPTFDELSLPVHILKKLALRPRGLVLVTGVAGSGKSTTIASMIDYINKRQHKHIVTIEDPVEYLFVEDKSIITQREIGLDTSDFVSALKHCVRQSPDVIFIGEMRDRETMEAGINAAETGHLVFSTLHTVNATQTVERIINFFPPYMHDLVRLQLALVVQGIISQRLLPRAGGKGRVPAVEILITSPRMKELLEKGRTRDLPAAMKEGGYYGSRTFNQGLKELVDNNDISVEAAMLASDNAEELKLELKGIHKGSRRASQLNLDV